MRLLTFYCTQKFAYVIYMYVHLSIVLCCGVSRAFVYQQITKYVDIKSSSLQSFVYESIQVIELQEHACPILMYGQKLFFVVFQKRCLYKFYYA